MTTRVNIDQRPRVTQFVGGALLMAALLLGAQSFTRSAVTLYERARVQTERQGGRLDAFTYVARCVRSTACVRAYVVTWRSDTGDAVTALYVTGVLWGATLLLVGLAWRPETAMLRATRMRSWRQFRVPERSAAPPGGKR
ncbi:hypothetical protein [Deinococcus pimensis]|uniref:hypothetical protein n=1 Tax=Deinococcus pimensis TaxID=309888 RepID=UPI0004B5C9E0|nr:hypothetical protein [Deinococcus pimensis]